MQSRSFNSPSGGPTTQYLGSQTPFANNLAAFTLCAWVYLTVTPAMDSAEYYPVLWKGFIEDVSEDLQGPTISLYAKGGSLQIWGERTYTGANAGAFSKLVSADGFNLNEWHHIAFTLGADKMPHLFFDGVETPYDAPTTGLPASGSPSLDDSTYPWTLGTNVPGDPGSSGYAGQMADVRVYSRALSGAELLTLVAFGEPSTANLEARWKLCSGVAPETDSSGNNHSLDNHGTTLSTNAPFDFCPPATLGVVSKNVPNVISGGSTVQFSRFAPGYMAPDWTYQIFWNGAAGKFSANGVGQPDGSFLVTMTPTQTNQTAGVYQFIERFTAAAGGAVKDFTCPQSITQVLPNPETANPGDFLTWEAKTLAILQQALAGNMSDQIQSYQIAGRAVSKYSLDQLKNMLGTLKSIVWRQQHPGALGPQYLVRFPPTEPDWWRSLYG